MFKIQKNTFQMLLISSHLDIVGRFSAQMKFEQLSRILKKFRKTEKNWNLGPFAESSFHFIISYRGRKTMILASFESSRSIFFDSWKRYTHRPVWPADFSWKLRSKKKSIFWINLVFLDIECCLWCFRTHYMKIIFTGINCNWKIDIGCENRMTFGCV